MLLNLRLEFPGTIEIQHQYLAQTSKALQDDSYEEAIFSMPHPSLCFGFLTTSL